MESRGIMASSMVILVVSGVIWILRCYWFPRRLNDFVGACMISLVVT